MRIIAGHYRGRILERPLNQDTRPTLDRVREGLFSMLTSELGEWKNLRILDAFAGSGAMGLEAISRGAAFAQFTESSGTAFRTLIKNVKSLGVGEQCALFKGSFFSVRLKNPFHVVFLDPPYYQTLIDQSFTHLETPGLLYRNALIVSEMFVDDKPRVPPNYILINSRTYGSVKVTIHRFDSHQIN